MVNPYFDDFFDMVYYINLAHRVDRNENSLRMLDALNIKNFTRIEAINANEIDVADIGLIDHRRSISKNNKACKMSHFKCLHDALDNGYEKICIFEDDFCFNQEDPDIVENLDTHLKNCFDFMNTHEWQFFYFDNNTSMEMDHGVPVRMKRVGAGHGKLIPNTLVKLLEGKNNIPYTGGKYRVNSKKQGHSYALKGSKIMKIMLEFEPELSLDKMHNAIQQDRHFYVPGIFDQLIGNKSDNSWGYQKLKRWK